MKKTVKNLLFLPILIFSINSFSQEKKTKETIVIKTSAVCEMCKGNIEKTLAFTKGIKKFNLDLVTKSISIVYNPEKISPEKIREAISKTGYDADSVPADAKAYESLHPCCKKDSH